MNTIWIHIIVVSVVGSCVWNFKFDYVKVSKVGFFESVTPSFRVRKVFVRDMCYLMWCVCVKIDKCHMHGRLGVTI